MDDDIEGTPPPLPASLPPSMEPSFTGRKLTASQKFLTLQAQLSTSNTMYSGGPSKKPKPSVKLKKNVVEKDEVDSDSISQKSNQNQKLVHRTLERPKRKGIRTPSKSSLSAGTSLNTITSTNQLLPADTPPDPDQPPPLPPSAPPPSIEEMPLLSDIVLPSPMIDDVFAADFSVSPEPSNDSNEMLSLLSINDPPVRILNSSLSSHDSKNKSSLSLPPSINKLMPTEELPNNGPPPSNELLPMNNALSQTQLTSHHKTAPLIDSLISTSLLVADEPTTTSTDSLPSTTKNDTSTLCDPPESPPYDASPPPPPISNPPKEHDQHELDNDRSIPHESHHEYREKEYVIVTGSHNVSPHVVSSSSECGNFKQQEKSSSPLMRSSHSAWSSSFHSISLHSSLSVGHHSKSFDDKSDYSLNSSNASLFIVPSANASIDVGTPSKISLNDNKPSSNVSKFRDRIAKLKQKRENLMPSPATSVQSEVVAVNSRVTSPLQSSYSATLLDLSDVTLSKPCTNYATNISPPHISSDELLTPLQSSPVSHTTANFLQFASKPPIISSDVKRVEPFTAGKISSSRISNATITPTQSLSLSNNDDSEGVKCFDVHSESAFSKPSSLGFTDNPTIVLSGLPPDVAASNMNISSNTDIYHCNDDDDDRLTPPPLPSSLPPDASESNGIFDLSTHPSPNIPETVDGLEDEIFTSDVPPLPTFPVPFEPSLYEQPFIESPSIEPPKNFSQTPPAEIDAIQILAPAEFASGEIVHDKLITIQHHNSGLQPQMLQQSLPKTVHPNSSNNSREQELSSQMSTSTGSSRHSIHLQYDLEPDKNKSGTLPMFICQHLVTQHQDDELSDTKTQKGYKKSSKLKFPWQKRLGHDRSHSMSDERLKRKGSKEDIRHSSIDIKQDVTDNSIMPRGSRNINRLKVANEPVTSASVGDLRKPQAADQNISALHLELSRGCLVSPVLTVSPSSGGKKPHKDEPDIASSSNQQKSLKMPDKLGESTVSLPHMTTPELYKKLSQPSDPSLFESIMKDFPLFNTENSLTEKMTEQPVAESKEKSTSANQQDKVPTEQDEAPIVPETLPDQKGSKFTTYAETDQSAVLRCQELPSSNHSDSLHVVTMDSFGSPPSPMGSVRSDQGWSSSAANTPNFHDKRWKDSALGSINTLTSNDSIRDLLKNRVTIGDWNVDHVIQWLESVELSSVVPLFRQFSINGIKLKTLNDSKLAEIGIHSPLLREQILQETWELLTANNETLGKKPRKTSSLLQGLCMVRKDLESTLKDKVPEDFIQLQSISNQPGEMLDSRLSAVWEQQEQTRELLEGGLAAFMASKGTTDHGRRRRSRKIKSLIALADPEDWSVDQVCEWLDQIGLGYYAAIFQEHQIDGSALCSLDMQTFAEMGVDSEEDREIILAKVYELFSQEAEAYDDYDDIEALLKNYSGEELEKIKAAISALKSPLLANDVELESSPAPFYFGADDAISNEALSCSHPMLTDTQFDDDDSIPRTPDPRHMRQGSLPLSKAYTRRFGRPSYINTIEQQFPALRRTSGRFSSVEDSPPPPLAVKQTSMALDNMAVSSPAPFVHSPQVSPISSSTPAHSPSSPDIADEAASEQQFDVPEPMTVSKEYTTKLAGKLAEKRKAVPPKAAQPTAVVTGANNNNKQVADKMKELASQLSHGELTLEGGASGVKGNSESGQAAKLKRKSRGGIGKKINTVKIKAGGMQSGLVRLYMVDIPHFAHVIYQAYLISSSTTSHQLIEQVLKRADIIDDPYRYYVYENCVDENGSEEGVVLNKNECPLKLQMEWSNFYGRRFELRWRPSHVINVRSMIRNLPSTTRPIQITDITPCSTLISLAAHAFQISDQCKELKIVAVHTKSKMEKELKDSDIPMKLITMQTAKWVVFSLRESAELRESTKANLQPEQQHQKQQQQQEHQQSSTTGISIVDMEPEAIKSIKSDKENVLDHTPSRQVVTEVVDLQKTYGELENEKEELERQLDDLQRRYNAVAMKSNNEAIVILEKENNRLNSELSTLTSKSALDAHTIAELSETVSKLERLLKEKDDCMDSMNVTHAGLQQGSNKMKERILAYEKQLKMDGKTLQDLKDIVGQFDSEVQNKHQEVTHLKHENTKLQKSLHEKEEKLRKSSLDLSKDDHTITTLKASLSKQEKDASFLRKEHQRQTLQLKAAEEQINSMRKVLKQKDEVITQLSNIEPWKNINHRSSLHTMLGAETIGTLISVRAEPQEKGLGIKLSSTEGAGCLVMEVADHSPLASIIHQGDRLLEINGEDISNSSTKQVVSLLKNLHESMQFVLLRPGPCSEGTVERLQKLKATLTEQVEKQITETQYWRNQYEQIRDATSTSASLQQEKDADIAYYKSTIEELNEQLTESKTTQEQLETMLKELHQRHDQHAKETTISVNQALQEHTEQINMMEANHQKEIEALQKALKENDQKIKLFRQHLVLSQPLDLSSIQASTKRVENLKTASHLELLDVLKDSEADCARHQAYLDQLLLLVIERCPELLNTMSANLDNTRTKAEKWC